MGDLLIGANRVTDYKSLDVSYFYTPIARHVLQRLRFQTVVRD